jgi:signal transduction histidine kinase
MRNNREYQICKDIAIYMRMQYPDVLFHYDLSGLNLSRSQAGMMKAIQGGRGWPDLFIAHPKNNFPEQSYQGLFIEIKKEGTLIWTRAGKPTTPHIAEQIDCLDRLTELGYMAEFGIGMDDCFKLIDDYLKL